jgi:integrase
MAQAVKRLSARAVATIAAPGRHSDGEGLYLNVTPAGARSWLFMWKKDGKRREMGLGSAGSVSLARARELASECRAQVAAGLDPIDARDAAAETKREKPTFGAIADALIAAKEIEWRNEKHRAQWRASLTEFAAPLRSRPVDEIDTAAVLAVLTPLWQTKPETASRVRGRIEAVLDAAKAQGHRSGENPAAWRGHLAHLLPKRGKLTRGHHAAMDYRDVPAFVVKLRECDVIAAMALEYCILTATRSGEVYGARWSEIDMAAKVWIVPAERMKAAREHRVPLCDRALAIIERLFEARTGEFVFPSPRGQRPLSHVAMAKVMRRLEIEQATVHGFRSAFRDWAGNETHFPREVAEAALAHVVGDKAEQAYRRGDALEKRRALMSAWATHCGEPGAGSNVVPLARKKQ